MLGEIPVDLIPAGNDSSPEGWEFGTPWESATKVCLLQFAA